MRSRRTGAIIAHSVAVLEIVIVVPVRHGSEER